jgi:subfamily B ATP-binding cassette protein MsbA
LIVAHRLSTIEHADRVVVMEQGRIVEQGAPTHLLASGGAYARLHHRGEWANETA